MKIIISVFVMIVCCTSVQAALTVLDSITVAGSGTSNRTIVSVNNGTTSYTQFEQATSATVTTDTTRTWISGGADPGAGDSSLTDDFVDTGFLNQGTITAQFGRTIGLSEVFLWVESDGSRLDGADFILVDGSGTAVSDTLSFSDVAYSTDPNLSNFVLDLDRTSAATLSNWNLAGLVMTVSDFSNITGTVTGIRITDNSFEAGTNDTTMIAIAAIPEPGTYALLLFGAGSLLLLRRKH